MKVPGRAWLEFEVVRGGGGALVHQTAVFEPTGLFGRDRLGCRWLLKPGCGSWLGQF
jgi:hypothetical protein